MKKTFLAAFLFILGSSIFAQQKRTPESTELWEPIPVAVTPGEGTKPPSDAIILFDGTNLNEWTNEKGEPAGWTVADGCMTVKPGTGIIKTKRGFGDCQLHIEWRTPAEVKGEGQGRGNSGIYLQSRYELQVLDSYENKTYVNGQAGSIYKQSIPLVNVCKKPGEWQTYDIIFQAPRFSENGRIAIPARITVLQNGVVIQNNVEIRGKTDHIDPPEYFAHNNKEPLTLQDHGNLVSYRNIWIREL
jgi:3-keto-disaccharide hydrolase